MSYYPEDCSEIEPTMTVWETSISMQTVWELTVSTDFYNFYSLFLSHGPTSQGMRKKGFASNRLWLPSCHRVTQGDLHVTLT